MNNSIVIVNFNNKPAVLALLKSLRLSEATSGEVILVDNASLDDVTAVVRAQYPMVKVLRLETNRGFAYAANKGLDQAVGDIIVLCHADVIADVHTLAELADEAREAEGRKVAAVLARLVNVTGDPQSMVGTIPGLSATIAGLFNPPAGLRCRASSLDHLADHEWGRFVCVALNRNYLATTGLMDPQFFLYGADTDLCRRIHRKQLRVLLSKNVVVTHGGAGIGKEIPEHLQRVLRNDLRKLAKKILPSWQQAIVSAVAGVRNLISKDK